VAGDRRELPSEIPLEAGVWVWKMPCFCCKNCPAFEIERFWNYDLQSNGH